MRKQKSFPFLTQESRVEQQDGVVAPPSSAPPVTVQQQANSKPKRQKSNALRAGLAIVSGRAAGALSRRLHLGGGTSIVGAVAQRLYPDIIEHLASQLKYGCVIVTGTNGKTTTSGFVSAIINDAGLRVWRNREGANLLRGVASSLVIRALPNGHLRRSGHAISVLEIDEAVLPQIVQVITPRVIVFTNLFRDQLDRYGEVDSVLAYWKQAIAALPATTILILNADDPAIAALGIQYPGPIIYYGIDGPSFDLLSQQQTPLQHQVMDARTCPMCGATYEYEMRFYSHMGHYKCPTCGQRRPQPNVRATQVEASGFDRLGMYITTPTHEGKLIVPLPGLYNIYNALAAVATAQALSISWEPVVSGIEQFKPAFGRGERIQVEGRTLRLLLAKNPTGFNEVLRTLFQEQQPRHVFFILNDNAADGRDVSWIWDVDFERAAGLLKTVVVGGTRALDLSLRLKYAGVPLENITIVPSTPLRTIRSPKTSRMRKTRANRSDNAITALATTPDENELHRPYGYGLKNALNAALQQTPTGETLFIVPTYTGLLEVHHELEQRGLAPHYWEGRDA